MTTPDTMTALQFEDMMEHVSCESGVNPEWLGRLDFDLDLFDELMDDGLSESDACAAVEHNVMNGCCGLLHFDAGRVYVSCRMDFSERYVELVRDTGE